MRDSVERVLDRFDDVRPDPRDRTIVARVEPATIRRHLADHYAFGDPLPLAEVIDDVADMLGRWIVDVTHPRYFGLFNPTVRLAGVVADLMTALFNPQLAAWSHAPAANEIEQHVLRHLLEVFGFGNDGTLGSFTSGGAESNLTAVVAALTDRFESYGTDGVAALARRPVFYASAAAHDSFGKICHLTGIGRRALRSVDTDRRLRLDVDTLQGQIEDDLGRGLAPFMVVATAGTTSAGIIDPIDDLVGLCREHGLWLHVDAAWAGAAALSPRLRAHLGPISEVDSITCDAHKWFNVPMAAGIILCRHRRALERAFRIATDYMPGSPAGVVDPYLTSVQWSRRFIGLKVFMVLAELGAEGFAGMIERQAECGELLRDKLRRAGWEIVNDTPLPVVCFTHHRIRGDGASLRAVLDRIYDRGRVWISEARLGETPTLRACITSYLTDAGDIDVLVEELQRALE
jgi:aromatic-L-amino-acid decarboxylase